MVLGIARDRGYRAIVALYYCRELANVINIVACAAPLVVQITKIIIYRNVGICQKKIADE